MFPSPRWLVRVVVLIFAFFSTLGCGVENVAGTHNDAEAGAEEAGDVSGADTRTDAFDSAAEVRTLTAIQVTPSKSSIVFGTKQRFVATGDYSDGATEDLTSKATWSSSDTTVATVDATGVATGIKGGTATITAALADVKGTADLLVGGDYIESVKVTPATATVAVGMTLKLTATATLNDKTTLDVTASAVWSTDKAAVATVDAKGITTGTGAGIATVTATFKAKSGAATITVL